MPLNIINSYGTPISAERLISTLLFNLNVHINKIFSAKSRLNNEIYDSEYNEFGNPRSHTYNGTSSIEEAEEEYKKALGLMRRFSERAAERATFPSLDVADEVLDSLKSQDPSVEPYIKKEKRGELEFLLVMDGKGNEFVIDVDAEITAESRRNMLKEEKIIGGEIYPLCSFIPGEHRESYDFYKSTVIHMLDEEA